jgi:DNA invertase Pin-like site-specific DNA recombinase
MEALGNEAWVKEGGGPRRRFVAYYRVSTGRQAASGLGVDAQRALVREFLAANEGRLLAEFSETISGRKDDRPQLNSALALCRVARATLIIARLDRLSRNVRMISRLMESDLDFVTADFPFANKFTIHILAAIAEYESQLQSERTKAAIAARRGRGVEPAKPKREIIPRFPSGCQQLSALVRRARSEARARDLAPLIWRSIADGKSYRVIADQFNTQGIRPARNAPWTADSIWRIVRMTAEEFAPKTDGVQVKRTGAAQIRVSRCLSAIRPLLLALRDEGASYATIASELRRRGIEAPQRGNWGPASIRRYLMRALNVASLCSHQVGQ